MPYPQFDRNKLKMQPLSNRRHTYALQRIYRLDDAVPDFEHPLLDKVAERVANAYLNDKQIIWMQGAHIIRQGNSRYIIDLLDSLTKHARLGRRYNPKKEEGR